MKAQNCYLLTSFEGTLSRVNINSCRFETINPCFTEDPEYYLDIALDRNNNLYYVDGFSGNIITRNLDSLSNPCRVAATFGTNRINSLVVDSTGKIYGAYDALYVYDPVTNTSSNLGYFPNDIVAYGDLTFFKGELYMATEQGIVQINIAHPEKSFLYMQTSLPNAYGIITIPANCNDFKTYITSFTDNQTSLVEVDLVNKKVLGTKCVLPFLTYGAASVVESGGFKKAAINDMQVSASCPGNDAGTIKISASGAGILSYSLDQSAFVTSDSFSLVAGGSHTLSVLDEVGCRKDTTAIVPVRTPLQYHISTQATSCYYSQDGTASVKPDDGTGTIEYKINEEEYTKASMFANLATGTYKLRIRQNNVCYYDSFFAVLPAPHPIYDVTMVASCLNAHSGKISVAAVDGQLPFLYGLDNEDFTASAEFANLPSGLHKLAIKDAKGCFYDTMFTIVADSVLFATSHEDVECHHKGKISIAGLQSPSPFLFTLNNSVSQADSTFDNLAAGRYTIAVTDGIGCVAEKRVLITANPYPCVDSLFFPSAFTPNKDGKNDSFRPLYNKPPQFYKLTIRNRWGQIVFETTDIAKGWNGIVNGNEEAAATYVFSVEYSYSSVKKKAAGTVALIR